MAGPWRVAAALVPYLAVGVGLYGLHSALAALLLYHAGMLAFLMTGRHRPARFRRGWTHPLVWPNVLLGVLACGATLVLWPLLGQTPMVDRLTGLGLSGGSWIAFMAVYGLVHPLLEETYWRDLLGSTHGGLVPEDLAFAGYHVLVLAKLLDPLGCVLSFTGLVGAAILWRWSVRRAGGMGPALAGHMIADMGLMIAAQILVRRGL